MGKRPGKIASDNGHAVIMYDNSAETIAKINQNYKADPSKVFKATTDLKEAVSFGDIILLAVPTSVIRSVLREINNVIEAKAFCKCKQGLEPKTFKRVSEIVEEEVKSDFVKGFVALSGRVMRKK